MKYSESFFCKKITLVVIFILLLSGIYSLEVNNFTKIIDTAFTRQSESDLEKILIEAQMDSNYSEVENYVLLKVRECLIYNRLEYAQFASLSLIDINLDNFEALDLYTRISKALIEREIEESREEEIRLAKVEKEKKEAEGVRDNFVDNFSQIVTAEGANVYFTAPENIRYSSYNWTASLGLLGLSFLSTPSINSLRFGVEFNGDFFYNADSIGVGAEARIGAHMISFVGSEKIICDFKIVPSIAFFDLSKKAFFRFGFAGIFGDSVLDGTSVDIFLSPVIGFEWKNINLGSTKSRLYLDYLFGHFAYDDITVAFDLGWKSIIPITDQGNFSINGFVEVADTVMVMNNGVDNNAKLTIGFGVGNYE